MSASLLSFDLVSLLFVVGVVLLVVSTFVMVFEMLHRRRSPQSPSPWLQGVRRGRPIRPSTPYAGVMLSPDAAKVLSVAQQRAGAKQASLDLGLRGRDQSTVVLGSAPTPLLDAVPQLAAIGSATQLALPPVGIDGTVRHAEAGDAAASSKPPRVVRHLEPGEAVTTEMVLDVLHELAQHDPERLVEIIQEWLRIEARRRRSEDGL
jgi:hypothetical protein